MSIPSPTAARADIESVLAQIRTMQSGAAQNLKATMAAPDVAAGRTQPTERADFSSMIGGALKQVNALQQASSTAASDFVTGKSNDLVGAMLASQKSSIAVQATTQVRNRVVSAYQDIMNMPI